MLSVQGEHDVYTAPSITEQVDALIGERVPFVIDLTPATFVDSSVLRVLLEARRRADEEGVGFAVALGQDDSGAVRRVLEVTGLIPVLPVHPARDAAVAGRQHRTRLGMSAAVSLRLPARPENVAVVRQALTGLGDAFDLDADLLGDIKTAVTEACNNVVLHAYEETEDGLDGDRRRLRRRRRARRWCGTSAAASSPARSRSRSARWASACR